MQSHAICSPCLFPRIPIIGTAGKMGTICSVDWNYWKNDHYLFGGLELLEKWALFVWWIGTTGKMVTICLVDWNYWKNGHYLFGGFHEQTWWICCILRTEIISNSNPLTYCIESTIFQPMELSEFQIIMKVYWFWCNKASQMNCIYVDLKNYPFSKELICYFYEKLV